jgi:hypothetical protein
MRVVVAVAVALVLASACAAAAARPTLRLASLTPLTVRGDGFSARERITLRITVGGIPSKRSVRAGTAGRFMARLDEQPARCDVVEVRALGETGHTAKAARLELPNGCHPGDDPPPR